MKQKDIALIIVVAAVSAVIAFVGSNMLFGSPSKKLTAEKVDAITPEFNVPDSKYFNTNSVDPTQIIHIGDNSNQTPFKQTQ